MKIEGNGFRYFIDGKKVLYKDLQTMIRLDMTVKIDGLNVYYSSPNKVKDRLILAEEFKKKALDEIYFKNPNFEKEQVSQACYTSSEEFEEEEVLATILNPSFKVNEKRRGGWEKENKKQETVNRLIEEELERQEEQVFQDWGSRIDSIISEFTEAEKRGRTIRHKPSGILGIEDAAKIMTEGVKTNKNKPQLSILFTQFPEALKAIARCSEYGHLKYKETDADYLNYQRVEEGSKAYADAGLRHRLYRKRTTDIESGLPHAYHVAWNALAELQIWIMENE